MAEPTHPTQPSRGSDTESQPATLMTEKKAPSITGSDTDQPTKNVEVLATKEEKEEYPTGLRLFIPVAAVMMTVFLTSLDQASFARHART